MAAVNFSLIRGRVILFVTVLCGCGLLLAGGFSLVSKKQGTLFSVQAKQSGVELEIERLQGMMALFENYQAEYRSYVEKGFLGRENRLSWVESLENIAHQLGLNDLRYHIEPQRKVSSLLTEIPLNIEISASKLSVETSLVHEGDLIALLDDLGGVESGLLIVDNCKVERLASGPELSSSGNFEAKCSTQRYTASYTDAVVSQWDDET